MRLAANATVAALLMLAVAGGSSAESTAALPVRGQPQLLHLYGERGRGRPIVVSSGDGGWIHLGPQVSAFLAARGHFVVGFDAKAYLEGFTTGSTRLRPEDVPGDYRAVIDYAKGGSPAKPILVGVSEGAGLSVLAAADPATKATLAGVVGLGLPDLNELGWRWRDALIYVTHGVPKEPTFSVRTIVDRLAPLPLAGIQSTRDEFVPIAQAQALFDRAAAPKRLWIVAASDHRFSGARAEFEQRLIEAIDWVARNEPQ